MPRKNNAYNKFLTMTKYEIIDQIESKALPRRMRKIGRAISARFDANALDGDGDGLVQDGTQYERPGQATVAATNLTQDALKPAQDKAKKSRGTKFSSNVSKATEALQRVFAKIPNWAIQDNTNIKTFPSRKLIHIEETINGVRQRVERRHGVIDTPRKAQAALMTYFKDVSLQPKIFSQLDRPLTPVEKDVIYGLIDHFQHVPFLKNFKFALGDSSDESIWPNGFTSLTPRGPGGWKDFDLDPMTIVEPFIEIRITLNDEKYRNIRKDNARLILDDSGIPHVDVIEATDMSDSVGMQLSKLAYDQGDENTTDFEKRRLNDLATSIMAIDLASHEGTHLIAGARSWLESHKLGDTLAESEGRALEQVKGDLGDFASSQIARSIASVVDHSVGSYLNNAELENLFMQQMAALQNEIGRITNELNSSPGLAEELLLRSQLLTIQKALPEFTDRYNRFKTLEAFGKRIIDENHPIQYFSLPFDANHPLHGTDIKPDGRKNYGDPNVLNAMFEAIDDSIFDDLISNPVYKEEFGPTNPLQRITNPSGETELSLDLAEILTADSEIGRRNLLYLLLRVNGYNQWDGINSVQDQKELLNLVKLISTYGSTKPNYWFEHDTTSIIPQEILAELVSFLRFGQGIQDINIQPSTKTLIIKWLDWVYGSRSSWKSAFPQVTLDALGV